MDGVTTYELSDSMPAEVRALARRFTVVHALNEFVGALPYSEWVDRAPSHARKQMLMAKVQDEVGHGHVTARLAEDLGVPRERVLLDYVEGKSKVHNIFHYDFASWEEFGPGLLLQNSAAIVQFQSLMHGVYLPYGRALRRIEREESFHYQHAQDMIHEVMLRGDADQRRTAQRSFETWLPRVLAYFGPRDGDTIGENRAWQLGMKPDSNDVQRQRWLTRIIPVFVRLGIDVDPALARQDESGTWTYAMPDWSQVRAVINNGGPASEKRLAWVRGVLDRNARYRRAMGRTA
jgi:ring-1,2-phenylacetyl-CoA epoxidase subunit PaaA